MLVWSWPKFERTATIPLDEAVESMLLLPAYTADVTPYASELNVDEDVANLLTVGHDGSSV